MKTGKKYSQDQLDTIRKAVNDDDDLRPFADVCVDSLNKQDKS